MLENYQIKLEPGVILTRRILEIMYDVPDVTLECLLADYSDGIVSGMELHVTEDDNLLITKGLYKAEHQLWFLRQDYTLDVSECDAGYSYAVELKPVPDSGTPEDGAVYQHQMEFCIIPMTPENQKHLSDRVLCIFKGRLHFPRNCADLTKTLFNLLKCRFACYHEPTYHPQVFQLVLQKLRQKSVKHPLDYTLMAEISRSGIVPLEVLRQYIHEAFPETSIPEDAENLFREFIRAIDSLHFYSSSPSGEPEAHASAKKPNEKSLLMRSAMGTNEISDY